MRMLYKDINIDYDYVYKGTNVTNVYLHGWGGDRNIFEWLANESNLNTLNVDLPPFGDSGSPKTAWGLDDYVGIVLALVDLLGLGKINLIAHSFGGRMSLRLASKQNIVNKMVLTDIAGVGVRSLWSMLKIFHYKWMKVLAKIGLLDDWFVGKSGSEDYSRLDDVMKKTFTNIVKVNQKHELKDIDAPCLVVWGDRDKDTSLRVGKYLAKHLNAKLVVLGGGHYAFLEHKEEYLKIVNEFLGS